MATVGACHRTMVHFEVPPRDLENLLDHVRTYGVDAGFVILRALRMYLRMFPQARIEQSKLELEGEKS